MAGCNCKKKVINNITSPDHIQEAKMFYDSIKDKVIEDFDDLDTLETNRIYLSLYPNSKGEGTTESMVRDIKYAIEVYGTRYRTSRKSLS